MSGNGEGHISIDKHAYKLQFQGFNKPLGVYIEGVLHELRPLNFEGFLAQLGRCMQSSNAGLKLDAELLIREVLAANHVPQKLLQPLGPIALWWALGGDREPPLITKGCLHLAEHRVHLRSWTAQERMQALSRSLENESESGLDFDFIAYVTAMIRASVVDIEPKFAIEHCDAAQSASLLEAVSQLNASGSLSEEIATWASQPGLQRMLQSTLKLCRVLGWGPSQLWSLPASEVDRLLAMVDLLEAPAPASRPCSGFAADPDAVVINIEEGA